MIIITVDMNNHVHVSPSPHTPLTPQPHRHTRQDNAAALGTTYTQRNAPAAARRCCDMIVSDCRALLMIYL